MIGHLGRHKWLMLVCLAAPLAALSAIFLFNVPAGSVLTLGLLLLCPAMQCCLYVIYHCPSCLIIP